LNSSFELAGALAAFLIVQHVLRRRANAHPILAHGLALLAGLFLWYDPNLLFNAHVWPQWDVWIIPFYLFAVYFGLTKRWILAGAFLGTGIMFKGQLMLVVPLLFFWPLFQLRWRALLEVTAGFALGAMIIVWPWMLMTTSSRFFLALALLIIGLSLRYIPRGWRVLFVCGMLPVMLALTGMAFGGSVGWYEMGFRFGSQHRQLLAQGPLNNLPGLLQSRFGWGFNDPVFDPWSVKTWQLLVIILAMIVLLTPIQLARHLYRESRGKYLAIFGPLIVGVLLAAFVLVKFGWNVSNEAFKFEWTMRATLVTTYGITLAICAIGLARHDVRNDRRMLIALAAPWVLAYCFMPQLHERYFLWGAAATVLAVGVSLGATLLHVVVTFLALLPFASALMDRQAEAAYPELTRFLNAATPGSGWATILVACMLLYLAVTRTPRRRPRDLVLGEPHTGAAFPVVAIPQARIATTDPSTDAETALPPITTAPEPAS
jgi:hypothetical protein